MTPPKIQMVDVKSQYLKIKEEVDQGIQEVIDSCAFINGPSVKSFKASLEKYLDVKHVIPCANGTDALQIALMALDLNPGDKVMVPAFTYVATAEVIALLGLTPVMVDVCPDTFNLTKKIVENNLTPDIKVVVPVHLYGQCSEMEGIMSLSQEHGFYVIEDNAQAIGSDFSFQNRRTQKSGTIGHIGCTSFYPSKNLGAYGDGGAICTNNEELGQKIHMIANHGQKKKYVHDIIGCNSRLDSIQAAILEVKLKHLDAYANARNLVAKTYDEAFKNIEGLEIPFRASFSNHVFHQYTLKVKGKSRDELKKHLSDNGIPSMIYYPIPLYNQLAFKKYVPDNFNLTTTEQLCNEVISLPIHTEMTSDQQEYIIKKTQEYFQ